MGARGIDSFLPQVHFRAKINGSYRKLLHRPLGIPAIPAPQGIIEPKPWALASNVVVKGDVEAVAAKSHDVNPVPLPVVSGDEAKSPVAAVPEVVKTTDSNIAPPSVTPVFSWGTSSSPKPWVFSPSKAFFNAGVTAAVKTPARRETSAVPTKPTPVVQTPPPPPSPVRQQTAPTMTLPPAPAFLPAASAPVPRAPYMALERAVPKVRAVPEQEVSVSDSGSEPAPKIISHSTSSIDELAALPVTEEKKTPPTSSAAATRPAPTPKVKTARQIWEAEMFSLRLLKARKLVPFHVIDQVNGWRCQSILRLAEV